MKNNQRAKVWAPITCSFVLLLSACGGSDDSDPVPATPPPATPSPVTTATTVNGPDGSALFIPAGATIKPVTFRIAKDSTGATPLPSIAAPAGDVYALRALAGWLRGANGQLLTHS